MSLSSDCHEVEWGHSELIIFSQFGMSLVWVCHELVGNDIKNFVNLMLGSDSQIKRAKLAKKQEHQT